jgi:hypothetical protein
VRSGSRRLLGEELCVDGAGGRRREPHELTALRRVRVRARDGGRAQARAEPAALLALGHRLLKPRVLDRDRGPVARRALDRQLHRVEVGRHGAHGHHPERDILRVVGYRSLDRVGPPLGLADRPVAHVVEEAHRFVRSVHAKPQRPAPRRVRGRRPSLCAEADRLPTQGRAGKVLHEGDEAVSAANGCTVRPFGLVGTAAGEAGAGVAPGHERLGARHYNRGRRERLSDLEARPEGGEEVLQRYAELGSVPRRPHATDAVDRETVPVQLRRGVARVEEAHDAVEPSEGRNVLDLAGRWGRRGEDSRRGDRQR